MRFCGVLNIDKPVGLTSRDVVDRVEKLVRPAKAGHAGTLDPLATGVLVVCVGHATRLITLAQAGRKRYLGRFILGQKSDTDDVTGNVVEGGNWQGVGKDDLESLLPEFVGRIQQTPPQFSAVHVGGRRAYALARRGVTVEIAPREVEVFSLRIGQLKFPEFELEIECGSGTYVRSIGRDIGSKLGCGAVMKDLRRLAVGPFELKDAIVLDSLNAQTIDAALQPALNVVSHLPRRRLTSDEAIAIRRGQSISSPFDTTRSNPLLIEDGGLPKTDSRIAFVNFEGLLAGIGEIDHRTNQLCPRIVFPD